MTKPIEVVGGPLDGTRYEVGEHVTRLEKSNGLVTIVYNATTKYTQDGAQIFTFSGREER